MSSVSKSRAQKFGLGFFLFVECILNWTVVVGVLHVSVGVALTTLLGLVALVCGPPIALVGRGKDLSQSLHRNVKISLLICGFLDILLGDSRRFPSELHFAGSCDPFSIKFD
jgi:hypothetical protein